MAILGRKNTLNVNRRLALVTAFLLFLLPVLVVADECRYTRELNFSLPVSTLQLLEIRAGAGALEVSAAAAPAADSVAVHATLCASRQDGLDAMDVQHSVDGSSQILRTLIPDLPSSFWTNGYAYIDLAVTVPAGLAVSIDDGSGEVRVSGSGALDIQDGSGAISASQIAGDITVRDGSGEIMIEEVQGSVTVRDGSGAIDIVGVNGDVDVDDGSGSMNIVQVRGRVVIRDGSGSIEARDIDKEVEIHEDGSGSVDVRGTNSSVKSGENIGSAGSGRAALP